MFHGSMVALITPFRNNTVDLPGLRELVAFHITEGTTAIIAAGTTGESGTLSHQEKLTVIETVIDATKNRIPVIAGTAAQATDDCITLTREAMALGAHAALIMTPAYIKPTQEGLYLHYSAIAKAVELPIILYNVPSRTACDLLPETVARLAKLPNIIGIKEATGQIERLEALLALTENQLDIYSGDDITATQWMINGAKGVISVTANIVPKQMAQLYEAIQHQDETQISLIHQALLPLHEALFWEANPIPVKWALSKIKPELLPELRLPLTTFSPVYATKLDALLKTLHLTH